MGVIMRIVIVVGVHDSLKESILTFVTWITCLSIDRNEWWYTDMCISRRAMM